MRHVASDGTNCRMEPFKDLEVDSVVNLELPVNVDVSIEVEMVGEQHALGSVAGSVVGLFWTAEHRTDKPV